MPKDGVYSELEQRECVCANLTLVTNLRSETDFVKTVIEEVREMFINSTDGPHVVDVKEYCEKINDLSEGDNMLMFMISDTKNRSCPVLEHTSNENSIVQIHPFNTSHIKKNLWLIDAKSPSTEVRVLINEGNSQAMNILLFLVKSACGPTVGRNPYHGQYTKMNPFEVEHHYEQTLTFSGPVVALGVVLVLSALWTAWLFLWKKIRQEELKEQRELRHFLANLDNQMNEREQEEEQEKLRKLLMKFNAKNEQSSMLSVNSK